MCGYIEVFYDLHFQWNKINDPLSGRAGFHARDMAVNFYLMDRNLKRLKKIWRQQPAFASFVKLYPADAKHKIDKMVNDFLGIAQQRLNKHMTKWHERNLHLYLAGDHFPAAFVASWLLGKEAPAWLPNTYHSEKHKTDIDIRECGQYLVSKSS